MSAAAVEVLDFDAEAAAIGYLPALLSDPSLVVDG